MKGRGGKTLSYDDDDNHYTPSKKQARALKDRKQERKFEKAIKSKNIDSILELVDGDDAWDETDENHHHDA